MARKYVSHIKSTQTVKKNLIDEGYPSLSKDMAKRPDTNIILDGEIAINYAKGHETLSIKNREVDENGKVVEGKEQEIVGFLSEKVTYENEHITAAAVGQLKSDTAAAVGQLKSDTAAAVGQLKSDTAAAVGQLKSDTAAAVGENEMITAAGIAHLDATKANITALDKTDASLTALSDKTDASDEEIEKVTASALSAIVGGTYGFTSNNQIKDEENINLFTLHRRVTLLENAIKQLEEKITNLENK